MKTLTNLKTVVNGDQVTITGTLVEKTFGLSAKQVTINFMADENYQWIRHAQMSQEALFVKRLGVGVAVPLEELVTNVASIIEPRLTYPPIFKRSKVPLTAEFSSELIPELQWQIADSQEENAAWTDIAGATEAALDGAGLTKGKFVRCRASSPAGSTFTTPALL